MILGTHRLVLTAAPFLGSLAALDGALAVVFEVAAAAIIFLHVATVADPVEAQGSEAFLRIALWTFGVVVLERRVRADAGGVGQLDLGVRHLQIVRTMLVLEMHRRGLTDMRFVTLLGIARRDVDTLLLGQLGSGLRLLGVGELLLTCLGRLLGLFHGGFHTRRVTMLLIATYRLPTRHHFTGGVFRIIRACDRGHHEPACRLRTRQHLHIVGLDTAADHYGEFACRADRVDLLLVKRVAGTIVAAHGRFRLGGGHMQWTGADVVDAAVRQLVDELHQAFRFGGQSDNGVLTKQCAGFARLHIGLADMHAIHLDSLVAGLPYHVRAIVDDERHGIGLAVVFDDLRDVAGHLGDVLRVGVLGAKLDERGSATQCVIDYVGDRTAFAILRADHEVRAHVETVSHGGVWIIAHCVPLCFW